MDDDLNRMTPAEVLAEVKKLRAVLRAQHDRDCRELRRLLPEETVPDPPAVEWTQLCAGCLPPPAEVERKWHHATVPPLVSLRFMRRA